MVRRKRCRFCCGLFYPDGRTKGKQYACGKKGCQKRRKKENQAAWLARHPGYFKGRYANTRKWLDEHPGYLADYRANHAEAGEKHASGERERRKRRAELAVDIQDLKSLQGIENNGVTGVLPSVDIQDSISTELLVIIGLMACLPRVDIQDSTDMSLPVCYHLGRQIYGFARASKGSQTHVHARKKTAQARPRAPSPGTIQLD